MSNSSNHGGNQKDDNFDISIWHGVKMYTDERESRVKHLTALTNEFEEEWPITILEDIVDFLTFKKVSEQFQNDIVARSAEITRAVKIIEADENLPTGLEPYTVSVWVEPNFERAGKYGICSWSNWQNPVGWTNGDLAPHNYRGGTLNGFTLYAKRDKGWVLGNYWFHERPEPHSIAFDPFTSEWRHLCFTFDGKERRYYINGELQYKYNHFHNRNWNRIHMNTFATTRLIVGVDFWNKSWNVNPFKGSIQSLFVMKKCLSADEVQLATRAPVECEQEVDTTLKCKIICTEEGLHKT